MSWWALGYSWLAGFLFFLGYGRASHDFAGVSHRQAVRQAVMWPIYLVIRGTSYWRWHRAGGRHG